MEAVSGASEVEACSGNCSSEFMHSLGPGLRVALEMELEMARSSGYAAGPPAVPSLFTFLLSLSGMRAVTTVSSGFHREKLRQSPALERVQDIYWRQALTHLPGASMLNASAIEIVAACGRLKNISRSGSGLIAGSSFLSR